MNSADGSSKQNLTNTGETDEYGPDWSPDGSKIVFTSFGFSFVQGEGDAEIAVMSSADGTQRQNLTDSAAHEDSPAFSPDGTIIVFSRFSVSRTRGERSDIFVISADGTTKAKKLTDTRAFEWGPKWQPLTQ
jgi:Tol biopolymer transport system component